MVASAKVSLLGRLGIGGILVALLMLGTGQPAGATPKQEPHGKAPPSCAAISFRPLVMGMPNGTHEAGIYKSRFTRMELMAEVDGGTPKTYFLHVNGRKLESALPAIPHEVEGCLKSKHVRLPVVKQSGACTGSRFRAVVFRGGKQKVAMLFGLQGDEWHLCTASNI
ncbi:MAG: hypothetical protein FD149_994 [Rhodospirillaceae bacterium]|nr:MAG: hypothetical protein FD149_994 [Rhodospirillaceae bacterium]